MTNDNKIKKNQNIFLKNLEKICDYSIMKKKNRNEEANRQTRE